MIRNRARWLGVAFAGFCTAAHAADLSAVTVGDGKPGALTWHGVTAYGVLDLGYAYETHGVPLSGAFYPGLEYSLSGSKNANKAVSSVAESALEQSKAGLKIEENLGQGWVALGKLEMGFQPLSGELANACASMVRNNGKPLVQQDANSDGSRCGQAFNGPAFAGLSHDGYGTLTMGRQQSLELDAIAVYDPMGLPYAFSLIGYSGSTAAGFGNTETGRWDNSLKYVYQAGQAHAALLYSPGAPDSSMFRPGYSLNAGGSYRGFSIDAVYARERSAVSSSSLGCSTSGAAGTCNATGVGGGNPCPAGKFLNGTATDGESWSAMMKYTLGFGDSTKDGASERRLSIFAGYVHTHLTNPHDPVAAGSATIGGYDYVTINNRPYATGNGKLLQTLWTGLKYELPSGLSFSTAYYRLHQDTYLTSAAAGKNSCAYITAANVSNTAYTGNPVASNCAGDVNQASFLIDYRFSKHVDIYAGLSHYEAANGLASGFLNTTMTTFATGLRLAF